VQELFLEIAHALTPQKNNAPYYISQLVRALWLVNLAGRILLYGPLKFKGVIVAQMFRDLPPSFLNFFSK